MRSAVVAEWRKLTSTALWWVLGLGMAGYLAFIGAVLAFSLAVAPADPSVPAVAPRDAALAVYGSLSPIGYVFPLVMGTLVVTSEVRHRTLTQTFVVEPRRSVVLAAKLVVALGIGLLYGVLGALGLVAAAGPVLGLAGDGSFLATGDAVRVLVLGAAVTGLWAVLGTAFGAVVPHQVAAVVGILAWTQLVEPIARLGLGAVDGLAGVASYLPGAAADAVVGSSVLSQVGGAGDTLPAWAGALVLLVYAAALVVAGRLTTFARDVT